MNKIKVLSSDISNKIAAGEVVERPASVVKELIENSVDAGATAITVEIKNGGITYIRITDNGIGMTAEDAKNCFLRHATSKISSADDLERIGTLGFRGEALASISAVSEVELLTKTKDGEGICLEISGGEVIKEEPAGCPDGTTFVVRNLFYNTPARMKFLKKDSTEAGYIFDIIERLALSKPYISLRFICDGKEKFFFGGDGNLKSCIYSVYGRDYAKAVYEINYEQDSVKVTGFVGKPEVARGNRGFQNLFVNGRYVKNKMISAVVENAYKNMMMVGKFPFFVINIDIPLTVVDINVHPTKQEVKFADEKLVSSCVYWAVKNALLGGADEIRNELLKQKPQKPAFTSVIKEEKKEKPIQFKFDTSGSNTDYFKKSEAYEPVKIETVENKVSKPDISYKNIQPSKPMEFVLKEPVKKESTAIFGGGNPDIKNTHEPVADRPVKEQKHTIIPPIIEESKEKPSYRTVGQLFDTYIIIELKNEIILIDQHAAHERMIFERLKKEQSEGRIMPQILLAPVVVALSPTEYAVLTENMEEVINSGFEVEDFGANSVLVRQTPYMADEAEIKSLLIEIANNKFGEKTTKQREHILETIACKAAIKANKRLTDKEIDYLIDEILKTGGVSTCPHGRPIMVKITKYELEKMFKRIQN